MVGRRALGLLGAAVASGACLRLTERLPEPWRRPWARVNHAGEPVTLLEGPSWVLGALTGLFIAGPRRRGRAATLLVTTAGLGMLDDLAGSGASRGLRGHLTALRRGEVTTGAVKLLGLAVAGVAVAATLEPDGREVAASRATGRGPAWRPSAHSGGGRRGFLTRTVTAVVGGGVIAGSANLVNLLDLRPGRALKSVIVLGAPGCVGAAAAAAAVGASVGVLADDLDARSMLGDTGANAAGALLGLALVERSGVVGRSLALAALTALTLASERVSFSAVIERHPALRRLDQWGRPPTISPR